MARQLDSSIYYSPKLESEEFLDILALNARELHFHFHFGKQFFNSSKPDRFLSLLTKCIHSYMGFSKS